MKIWWTIFLLFAAWMMDVAAKPMDQPLSTAVTLIHVQGPISPTTTNYIVRGIASAKEAGHAALIIQMDTRGGLLESTKDSAKAMVDWDALHSGGYVRTSG